MRKRHTSRTDPDDMGGVKVPVTFRLGLLARNKMQSAANMKTADITNISDALQDACWLWIYEFEKEHGELDDGATDTGNGGSGRPTPQKSGETEGADPVAEDAGQGEGGSGVGTEGDEVRQTIPG